MTDDELKSAVEDAAEKCGMTVMTPQEVQAYMDESAEIRKKVDEKLKSQNRQEITEESGIHKQWYEQAKDIKGPFELHQFVSHLLNDYIHDYGTICHACSAAAIAACHAIDSDPDQGGITGFQASCIMGGFIRHWMHIEGSFWIRELSDMLYPQNEERFTSISQESFDWLKEQAQKKMDEYPDAATGVYRHWKEIAEGKVPFGYAIGK